jgi:hypothetical protein
MKLRMRNKMVKRASVDGVQNAAGSACQRDVSSGGSPSSLYPLSGSNLDVSRTRFVSGTVPQRDFTLHGVFLFARLRGA